jgi:hypothetical protein
MSIGTDCGRRRKDTTEAWADEILHVFDLRHDDEIELLLLHFVEHTPLSRATSIQVGIARIHGSNFLRLVVSYDFDGCVATAGTHHAAAGVARSAAQIQTGDGGAMIGPTSNRP